LPVSVDKNINKRVIVEINIHIIDCRFSLVASAMFFKIIVMVGSWIFSKLFAISKIHGNTNANNEIIATILTTINIIG
jgi:hypothetical protein